MGERRIVNNAIACSSSAKASSHASSDAALSFHRSLPGYAATPLLDCASLAAVLGVARVWVKDESSRFGLPSFKVLGVSWAAYRTLCEHVGANHEEIGGLKDLRTRLAPCKPLTLVAATDGNHGRAVARVAAWLDLDAHIIVPCDMIQERIAEIEREGARVTVVSGTYDDAVQRSAQEADARHLVISDTSWAGYERVPAWVIEGYATIAHEVRQQLRAHDAPSPSLVAVPIGVGALAAAMARDLRRDGTSLLGVEPTGSDCMLASIEARQRTTIPGPHLSIMAGLNCGTPSLIAWPTVSREIETFVAVDDERAREAMRMLAKVGVVSGESGAASLAGVLDLRDAGRLAGDAQVLLLSTEGATDPIAYEQIVGAPTRHSPISHLEAMARPTNG